MGYTKEEIEKQKKDRLGLENVNNQGYIMKIIEYPNANHMTVQFLDEYNCIVQNVRWTHFVDGEIKNPYAKTVYGIGIKGNKYSSKSYEYKTWQHIMERCYSNKWRERYNYYSNTSMCKEWLLFENFYEWLHKQENFEKFLNGDRWAIDKDILIKDNDVYSPDTCCLVPVNVNSLFTKSNLIRGKYPIGVHWHKYNEKYAVKCRNPFINKEVELGYYDDVLTAFNVYKKYKENIIKQVAEIEYKSSNITKQCYDAMMKYEVEITD